jgi:hypothetical protein
MSEADYLSRFSCQGDLRILELSFGPTVCDQSALGAAAA